MANRFSKKFCQSVFTLVVFLLLGCAPTPPIASPTPDRDFTETSLQIPNGYRAEKIVSSLKGPTQMIFQDGALWVAQLNGDENARVGQVLRFAFANGKFDLKPRVLLENLDKPTGIAILDNALWIQQKHSLLRAVLNENRTVSTPEIILNDLPFNTRSEGTLTVSPDNTLLFETSGNRIGNDAEKDSAVLWELDPRAPQNPKRLARGLKNAYAHVFDAQGRLWATDVADDLVNGVAPPDELNLIVENSVGDYGWPPCFGKREAAVNYGGTTARCEQTLAASALFPPRSTPTSIVVSPFEKDALLVALWGPTEPSVVRVRIPPKPDAAATIEPFLKGLAHPQHLLVTPDNALLISDFETGVVYRLAKQ